MVRSRTPVIASPSDVAGIYRLLKDVRFYGLPEFEKAKPILEAANALILKEGDKVILWAAYHGKDEISLDVVIAPTMPRHRITKGLSKHILAHGLKLAQNGVITVEAYNPKGIKAALAMGFKLSDEQDRDGWVKLRLTREMFERKFKMRGKPIYS